MKKISKIYLTKKLVTTENWLKFIDTISRYNGYLRKWSIIISFDNHKVEYYLETKNPMPPMINNNDNFLLKKEENTLNLRSKTKGIYIPLNQNNIIEIYDKNEMRQKQNLKYIKINILPLNNNKTLKTGFLFFEKKHQLIKKRIIANDIFNYLSIDFEQNTRFFYKKASKYLNIQKQMHLFKSDNTSALLHIDPFPYFQGDYYLNQTDYSFNKHSMVIGSSGTGKSKLISSMISNLTKNRENMGKYKVIVIDPHADLENDIGGLPQTKVIDFNESQDSVDLFTNTNNDVIATTELLLSLFKDLIADQYNSKLERVLRHSIHLLLLNKNFNFITLRNLLLNSEYRSNLLNQIGNNIPNSIIDFFLTDFNDLRTQSYTEAISPIISFIDEMQLLPVFNNKIELASIQSNIQNNFLTIFSLNRTKLGDKVTKTIAGLIMQQILSIVQSYHFDENIILVVDEVSVVENPILCRFLSEARKYGLSIVLAQQYFNQISNNLKDAILANVVNYYVFRVSRIDANLIADSLNMKISSDDTKETKIKILSELNNRECIIRIDSNGILLPAFKAKTIDFTSYPRPQKNNTIQNKQINQETNVLKRKWKTSNPDLKRVLETSSQGRNNIGDENE